MEESKRMVSRLLIFLPMLISMIGLAKTGDDMVSGKGQHPVL